jgi:hypothetical protein
MMKLEVSKVEITLQNFEKDTKFYYIIS